MLLGWAALAFAAPTFPALTGRVVDQAGLLSASTEAELTRLSEALEVKTGSQLVVATVPDLQGYELEDFGYQLGRSWGLGRDGEDDGLLLLVAKAERKVRIEVAYGLEGIVTDALSSVIIQRQIVPAFKAGDFDRGVLAGANALAEQVAADPERQLEAVKAAADGGDGGEIPGPVLVLFLFIALVILMNLPRGRRGQRVWGHGASGPVILWGGTSGGGSWGGGGGGGGGFSGGGGSFGGGGASGSW